MFTYVNKPKNPLLGLTPYALLADLPYGTTASSPPLHLVQYCNVTLLVQSVFSLMWRLRALHARLSLQKYMPLDLREKKTRAIRRQLTPKQVSGVAGD